MAREERKRNRGRAGSGREAGRKGRSGRPGGGDGPVWIYGAHAALAALANPARRNRRALLTEAMAREHGAALAATRFETADRAELERVLPPGAVHQGIAVLADPLEPPALEEVLERATAGDLMVALDRVSDPQNVGAVLRSAAAFGALAVVAPKDHAPPVTSALAKAASGALEAVPLIPVTNLARALDAIKAAGFWCMGLDAAATIPLADAHPEGRACVVLGAEGAGLRRLTAEACDGLYRLPTVPPIRSLNVSNAAAVALYELARTRIA